MMNEKIVLGIETSCDDTSICLLRGIEGQSTTRPTVLSHHSFSQEAFLQKWGGVVPEIAARNHVEKLLPLLQVAFDEADITPRDIDLIGVTTHPGLLGPLLTGLNCAKTISLLHQRPIFPVNHIHAHLEAIHLVEEISYPYLGMAVSGGHSLFMLVRSHDDFIILGGTIDDAAGEAFDKGGKILGLPYPAGRIIDEMAKKGDPNFHHFPIGLSKQKTIELSFSGVKTSLRNYVEQHPEVLEKSSDGSHSQHFFDLVASYQHSIVKALTKKLAIAVEQIHSDHGKLPIVIGGGVACNSALRAAVSEQFDHSYFVPPKYCTDNGAMIANLALRNASQAIPFPKTLYLDARGRFIQKDARKGSA